MSDELSEALAEAYATARTDIVEYYAFELYAVRDNGEPAFTEPARVVWGWEEISAKHEDTAINNPGEMVLYRPGPIDVKIPETVSDQEPQLEFTIFDIGKDLIMSLEDEQAGDPCSVFICMRVYLSNRLALGPEKDPPVTFELKSVQVNSAQSKISGRAGFNSFLNRQFPFRSYTLSEFPGLRR